MKLIGMLCLVTVLLCYVSLTAGYDPATCIRCRQSHLCNPPECFCCRDSMPLTGQQKIPQMVFFTFDDAITPAVATHYRDLFDSRRKNPNGCPISMTLFVSHSNTVYSLVKEFYDMGMEIGSHSVTHSHPNAGTFKQEARAQKENLANKAKIPIEEIYGWRSPFLEPLGDTQPSVLKELGYEYDATLTMIKKHSGDAAITPFTLDHGWPYDCKIKQCPQKQHKGFWEVPVVSVKDYLNKYDCVYVDGCNNPPPSEETAFQFLWDNFQTYYTSNRAPFGINMHASWFFFENRKAGMNRFIQELVKLDDVYIVSVKQVIEWLKSPTPLSQILNFKPWGCDSKNQTAGRQTQAVLQQQQQPKQTQIARLSNMRIQRTQKQRQTFHHQNEAERSPTHQPALIPAVQQQQQWPRPSMNPVPPIVPNLPMVRFWWRQSDVMMQREMERMRNIQMQQEAMQNQRLEQERRLAEQQRQQEMARNRQMELQRQQALERNRQQEQERQRMLEQQRMRQQQLEKQRLEGLKRQQQLEQQRQEEIARQKMLEQQRQKEIEQKRLKELKLQEQQQRQQDMQNRQQHVEQQEAQFQQERRIQQQHHELMLQQQKQIHQDNQHQGRQSQHNEQQNMARNTSEDSIPMQTKQELLRRQEVEKQRLEKIKQTEVAKAQEIEKRRMHELAMIKQKEFESIRSDNTQNGVASKQVEMERMRLEELKRKQMRKTETLTNPVDMSSDSNQLPETNIPNSIILLETSTNTKQHQPLSKQRHVGNYETTRSVNLTAILAEDQSKRMQHLETLSLAELQVLQDELKKRLQEQFLTMQMTTQTPTTSSPVTTTTALTTTTGVSTLIDKFKKLYLPALPSETSFLINGKQQINTPMQQEIITNAEQYLGPISIAAELPDIDFKPINSFGRYIFPEEFINKNDIKVSKIPTTNTLSASIKITPVQTVGGDLSNDGIERNRVTTDNGLLPTVNNAEFESQSNTVSKIRSDISILSTAEVLPITTTSKPLERSHITIGNSPKIFSKPMWQLNAGDMESLHMPWKTWALPDIATSTVLSSVADTNKQKSSPPRPSSIKKPPVAVKLFSINDFINSVTLFSTDGYKSQTSASASIPLTSLPVPLNGSTPRPNIDTAPSKVVNSEQVHVSQNTIGIPLPMNAIQNVQLSVKQTSKTMQAIPNVTLPTSDRNFKKAFTIPNIGTSGAAYNSTQNFEFSSITAQVSMKPTTSLISQCKQDVNCFAPHCVCKSDSPPEKMAVEQVPQIVYITIDGSLNFHSYSKITSIFSPRRLNPNGCRIRGTLFVTDAGSSYRIANALHSDGIEIAISGLSSRPHSTVDTLRESFLQQKDRIARSSNIHESEIKGWRSPGLTALGDEQFDFLANHSAYDSSIVLDRSGKDHSKVWPFTLDFGVGEECIESQCPSRAHPGVWEVPVIPFVGPNNSSNCEYTDSCTRQPASEQETLDFLMNNFNQHYKSNRAPFAIRLKQVWFHWYYRENLSALLKFLDTILEYGDVYVTSIKDMLEYIERPLPLRDISRFEPWKC